MPSTRLFAPAVMLACALVAGDSLRAHPRNLTSVAHKSNAGQFLVDDWRLDVKRDAFSGDVICRLRSRDGAALYVQNAIGFCFGRKARVMQASFRIDDGQVMRWRDQLPELARLRVSLNGRDMSSPTDGIVWLPAAMLDGARTVSVQPRPGASPKTFSLAGLAELLGTDDARNCISAGQFVQ